MRKWLYVAVAVLVIVVAVGMAKDLIIKVSVENGVEMATGLPLKMAYFHVSLLDHKVHIKGMEMMNPKNFKDRVMLNVPEIYVDYDPGAAMSGKIHLMVLRLDLKELYVVKDAGGDLNIDHLNTVKSAKGARKAEPSGIPPFMIDDLSLKIGKVAYRDYTNGTSAEYDVGLDENFKNVNNVDTLVGIIMVKALMKTPIGALANFDVGGLQRMVSGQVLGQASSLIGKATGTAAKESAEAVGEAAGNIMKMFGK